MKRFNKIIGLITAAVLLLLAPLLASCENAANEGKAYEVYYTNMSKDDLISGVYNAASVPGITVTEKAGDLISRMFEKDYTDEDKYSAKPDNVELNSYVMDDDILTVDFSEEYLEMTNVQELILRAALVLTVIQIDGVNGVRITVCGSPVTDSDGVEIGVMTADDFVSILLTESGMLQQETDVTLYFTNESGDALIPVKSHFITTGSNTSIEEYIITQLIAGPPEGSGLYPTVSPDVELISIATTENICYVNFDSSFMEQEPQPVSDEILIYSITNSLCRLSFVSGVRFLINGEAPGMLHTITDLSVQFTRNRDLEESFTS